MSSAANVELVNAESSLEEHFKSEWKINHFAYMTMPLCTPVFSPVKGIDTKFVFQIWYKAIHQNEGSDISYLYVLLRKVPGPPDFDGLQLDLHVSVHYSNGRIYERYRTHNYLDVNNLTSHVCIDSTIRFSDKIQLSASHSSPRHGALIQSQALILRCRMNFSNHLPSTAAYHHGKNSLLNLMSFAEDFKGLYLSSTHSDVSIQIGDETIESHKDVLVSHSPVFRRMLEHGFEESRTGVIKISDVDYETFQRFLKYLYCAEVEDQSLDNLQRLYVLADKYDVQILKQRCAEIISDSCLEVDGICEVLEMAYCYDDEILKKSAKLYAAANIKKILPTTEWKNLVAAHPIIGYEVLLHVYVPEEYI